MLIIKTHLTVKIYFLYYLLYFHVKLLNKNVNIQYFQIIRLEGYNRVPPGLAPPKLPVLTPLALARQNVVSPNLAQD